MLQCLSVVFVVDGMSATIYLVYHVFYSICALFTVYLCAYIDLIRMLCICHCDLFKCYGFFLNLSISLSLALSLTFQPCYVLISLHSYLCCCCYLSFQHDLLSRYHIENLKIVCINLILILLFAVRIHVKSNRLLSHYVLNNKLRMCA